MMSDSNYKLVVGLDFTEPVFIHAVLHMSTFYQDKYTWVIDTDTIISMF